MPHKLTPLRWLLAFVGLCTLALALFYLRPRTPTQLEFDIRFTGNKERKGEDYFVYTCTNRSPRFLTYEVETSKGTAIRGTIVTFQGSMSAKNLIQPEGSFVVEIPKTAVDSEALTFCWCKVKSKKYYQLRLRQYFFDHKLPVIAGLFPGSIGVKDVEKHGVPLPW